MSTRSKFAQMFANDETVETYAAGTIIFDKHDAGRVMYVIK